MVSTANKLPSQIDLGTARRIIDFSGGITKLDALAEVQLKGAVALYNRINNPEVQLGYLADEVGMGKTYIALGVVALMRYFNPRLRVLYICPSRNVQEKWQREYQSFVSTNVRTSQFRIRTPDGRPAAPFVDCNDLSSLLSAITTGYYADVFTRKDSFSLGMTSAEDNTDEYEHFLKQISHLDHWVPARAAREYARAGDIPAEGESADAFFKNKAKDHYARVVNHALPTFDLVVIDEAHNFKHGFNTSYRNRVLSQVLGTYLNEDDQPIAGLTQRVGKTLLLSATPYDRNLDHLRKQLRMVGRQSLLEGVDNDDKAKTVEALKPFMVRRLNTIRLNGEEHSRNQYRVEHRTGPKAVVELESDEQKLITALVQKKVGDLLGRHRSQPSFQVGLLSSFESYADSIKEPVRFDGDPDDKPDNDAPDRGLIARISQRWEDANLGTTLPHPKMDVVSERLADQMFRNNRKQLVFVRRVKSVRELKQKLDEAYDQWLMGYLERESELFPQSSAEIATLLRTYRSLPTDRQADIDETATDDSGASDSKLPPKRDNLFNWFFRGDCPEELKSLGLNPDAISTGLAATAQPSGLLLEVNWIELLLSQHTEIRSQWSIEALVDRIFANGIHHAPASGSGQRDYLGRFQHVQLAALTILIDEGQQKALAPLHTLLSELADRGKEAASEPLTAEQLASELGTATFFSGWYSDQFTRDTGKPLLDLLFGSLREWVGSLNAEADEAGRNEPVATIRNDPIVLLRRVEIHRQLIVNQLRNGHGIIDLYLSRLRLGEATLDQARRDRWISEFTTILSAQQAQYNQNAAFDPTQPTSGTPFSTFAELSGLSDQLDAVIKANVPELLSDKRPGEFRRHIANRLAPLAPIIGASGETGSGFQRSNQARKFRMPGYPLALVSTDVFQEGEDLHLFCDSVVHYGISASPVSIEQKTGRVDRVGALAHRNLSAFRERSPDREQMIQVSFPYVQESIEYMQVRQTCRNINEFIDSLDQALDENGKPVDTIEPHTEIHDHSPIPEQITRRLIPHYEPDDVTSANLPDLHTVIESESERVSQQVRLIKNQLASVMRIDWEPNGIRGTGFLRDHPESKQTELLVELKSARSSGDFLLCLTDQLPDHVQLSDYKGLISIMKQYGSGDWCRLCEIQGSRASELKLVRNAELLIQEPDERTRTDIEFLVKRFTREPGRAPQLMDIKTLDLGGSEPYRLDTDEWPVGTNPMIKQSENRCVLIATVATREELQRAFPNEAKRYNRLRELTVQRNREVDVTEYLLDDNQNLIARAASPMNSLTAKKMTLLIDTVRAGVIQVRQNVV